MKQIKVMTVFGTRPEAIKMAPLIKQLELAPEINSVVCVTAQHREMLDQVLDVFAITPDYDLNIMQICQTLEQITTNGVNAVSDVIKKEMPDIVLVHGDTSTTFAAALAAFYNKVKVGHVEAGLRTYNKFEPFPEEMNRRLTTALADIFFAPTEASKINLLKENISAENIAVTGNTVIDCFKYTVKDNYVFSNKQLNDIDYKNSKVIAMTAHRRENLGKPLEDICHAVKKIATEYPNVKIVYAVHKNPAVKDIAYKLLGNTANIYLTDPLDVEDMHNLFSRCYLALTDSGGLQEEVPSFNKPVLVLRNVTERPEGIEAGTLLLAGTDRNTVYERTKMLLSDTEVYERMCRAENPFGDGKASERIVKYLLWYFGVGGCDDNLHDFS